MTNLSASAPEYRDALAIKHRAAQAQAPAGWKMVPLEPTLAQLVAATKCSARLGGMATGLDYYRAMVAAAPQAATSTPAALTDDQIDATFAKHFSGFVTLEHQRKAAREIIEASKETK